jgi:hypothetical protein
MQNFGKIKNVFNNLLIEGIVKKDDNSKKLFKKYMKSIKESEILKTQFLVYSNIENKVDTDSFSANVFVSENIKLLEKYSTSDILKENLKLVGLLKESKDKMVDDYELSTLHESLSNLVFTKRTPKNIEKITQEIKNITSYITTNKVKEVNESVDLPLSMMTNIMVDKYNEKYDKLDESDREILKVLLDTNFENKKNFYNKLVNECAELINSLLKESDKESGEKLTQVKTKLLDESQELVEGEYVSKLSKLIELKNNLKSN